MPVHSSDIYTGFGKEPESMLTLLVLADALEEEGQDSLSAAYRWAAYGSESIPVYWPWPRMDRESKEYDEIFNRRVWNAPGPSKEVVNKIPRIFDWESIERYYGDSHLVPQHALIPHQLYLRIKQRPPGTKKYGSVHDAFALLANDLPAYLEELKRLEAQTNAHELSRE